MPTKDGVRWVEVETFSDEEVVYALRSYHRHTCSCYPFGWEHNCKLVFLTSRVGERNRRAAELYFCFA
jgi:hypothetical protein